MGTYSMIDMPASSLWFGLLVVLIVIEIFTLGLTTIWFAGGALIAWLMALLDLPFIIQGILFVVVSIVLLIFTRPIAVRYFNSKRVKTNADTNIGKTVRVTKAINNLKSEGQVVVGGMEWTARSTDDTVTFAVDEMVRVAAIEGVKLMVEKL